MNVFPRCGHERTEANSLFLPFRQCKTCHVKHMKDWRSRNPGYNAKYLREWRRGIRRTRDRLTRAWRGVST